MMDETHREDLKVKKGAAHATTLQSLFTFPSVSWIPLFTISTVSDITQCKGKYCGKVEYGTI